jgi:hypothetical protein
MAWMTTASSLLRSRTPISSGVPSRAGPMSIVRSSSTSILRVAVRTACQMSASSTPCFLAGSPILTQTPCSALVPMSTSVVLVYFCGAGRVRPARDARSSAGTRPLGLGCAAQGTKQVLGQLEPKRRGGPVGGRTPDPTSPRQGWHGDCIVICVTNVGHRPHPPPGALEAWVPYPPCPRGCNGGTERASCWRRSCQVGCSSSRRAATSR